MISVCICMIAKCTLHFRVKTYIQAYYSIILCPCLYSKEKLPETLCYLPFNAYLCAKFNKQIKKINKSNYGLVREFVMGPCLRRPYRMLVCIRNICRRAFGQIKIFGISLGVTFVLFTGILMGHFGFTGETHILHFIREFGLILFVFCIGLQVGPSFFSSFKKGGMTLNMLAVGIVVLNIAVALGIYFIDGGIDLPMIVGILTVQSPILRVWVPHRKH